MNQSLEPTKDQVLAQIKDEQTRMRPKWQFLLRGAAMLVSLILASAGLMFLASLILFVLHVNGVWFAPGFGLFGLQLFFVSLPWLLIGLTIFFFIIIEKLIHRYAFAYRRPVLVSAGVILGSVVLGCAIIAQTPFHGTLLNRAYDGRGYLTKKLYRDLGLGHPENVHTGQIVEFIENGFIITNRHNGTTTVIITPRTRLPLGFDIETGDTVMIMGKKSNTAIESFGIRLINERSSHQQMMGQKRAGWYLAPLRLPAP